MSDFDDATAADWLNGHAFATSNQACATHVRLALHAGGIDIPAVPARRDAKNYGSLLIEQGFVELSPAEQILPARGDVAVIQPYAGGNPAGHVTMYTGQQWVSDFRQTDMWSGPGYRTHKPPFKVYRWRGAQP
ncbi:hypothetical protein [Paraburkholderia rhizosphaerae]|uniref:NlpC/P60 family protein n=1 Tax=Paraburkholderia rhizosphaerae TaxID=480658 RepID=A0A4R8LCL5_9BURK|nr:hypothetical protein [Paraburkholderia rhizosphaerae]TDY40265.1 hypothetical protein BX592_12618 [Paraburkholderia rhizosphaerae]